MAQVEQTKKDVPETQQSRKDASEVQKSSKDTTEMQKTRKVATEVQKCRKDSSKVQKSKKDASKIQKLKKDESKKRESKNREWSINLYFELDDGLPRETNQRVNRLRFTFGNISSIVIGLICLVCSSHAGDFQAKLAVIGGLSMWSGIFTALVERGMYNGIRYKGGPRWKPNPEPNPVSPASTSTQASPPVDGGELKEIVVNKALNEGKDKSPMNPEPAITKTVKDAPPGESASPKILTDNSKNSAQGNVTTISAECYFEQLDAANGSSSNLLRKGVKANSDEDCSFEVISSPKVPTDSLSNVSKKSESVKESSAHSSFEELNIPYID